MICIGDFALMVSFSILNRIPLLIFKYIWHFELIIAVVKHDYDTTNKNDSSLTDEQDNLPSE